MIDRPLAALELPSRNSPHVEGLPPLRETPDEKEARNFFHQLNKLARKKTQGKKQQIVTLREALAAGSRSALPSREVKTTSQEEKATGLYGRPLPAKDQTGTTGK